MTNYKAKNKVLIIDGTNTFMRGLAVSNLVNKHGIPIGGITSFLISIGYILKKLQPQKIIIAFDGMNSRSKRREISSIYKANRDVEKTKPTNPMFTTIEEEQKSREYQFKRLFNYFSVLPVQYLIVDNCEADDVIAHIAQSEIFENYDKYIMSTDTDFYQLINDSTFIYSPFKKVIYNRKKLFDEINLMPENYALSKSIIGDSGDNVIGIKGIAMKSLQKLLPELFTVDNVIQIDHLTKNLILLNEENKSKKFNLLKENIDTIKLNLSLISLDKPLIGNTQIQLINNHLKQKANRLNKIKFIQLSNFDGTMQQLKNVPDWLSLSFKNADLHSAFSK